MGVQQNGQRRISPGFKSFGALSNRFVSWAVKSSSAATSLAFFKAFSMVAGFRAVREYQTQAGPFLGLALRRRASTFWDSLK